MNCSTFLQSFSDFRDGLAPEHVVREMESHVEECGGCARYLRVVDVGLETLRARPPLDVPTGFRPRLRHRLFHVDDEAALMAHAHSGTTVLSVLGIALVLTAVAWSPTLLPSAPTVDLAPIVVSDPPAPLAVRPVSAFPFETAPLGSSSLKRSDLWDDANSLLLEYSPLSQRYRARSSGRRSGLDHP